MPLRPGADSRAVLRPLGLGAVHLAAGFWDSRQQVNRSAIGQGHERLIAAGNLENFSMAAGRARRGAYRGAVFMDSDVYKWLESVAWECARWPSEDLRRRFDEVAELVAAAQRSDGYLNTFAQVSDIQRYTDLAFGHELYCYGHLFQAAVAGRRCLGNTRLWQVSLDAADHLVATFGDDANSAVPGHPLVEMALVELTRESGNPAYTELARAFVGRRGRNTLAAHGRTPSYFSDRVPVRHSTTVEGHAVRAMYLAAGATDVVLEGRDDPDGGYFRALQTQWDAMVATKTYVTGGLGSRWDGEAFGDPYELPPDVSYCETCAAIGSVQWSWRMLLASGGVQYADLIERTLYNGMLAGVSLSGDEFFYVNALQLRAGSGSDDHRHPANGRSGWFDVACCPPNVMRTVASLAGYVATESDVGMQLHQYMPGTIAAGFARLRVSTEYPWRETVEIEIEQCDEAEWELALRIPAWCVVATVAVNGRTTPATRGYWRETRQWQPGDRVVLQLPMPVRITSGDPRVDAVRGCVAIERGPLVYCVEQVDQPDLPIDEFELVGVGDTEWSADLLAGVNIVRLTGRARGQAGELPVVAVPYYAWANRGVGSMRVWLPTSAGTDDLFTPATKDWSL